MNNLRNKVQLIGNLGNAPEIRQIENGQKLVKFNMATNEPFVGRTGKKESDINWHTIVAWGGLAEIAEKFLTKGKKVAIEGKLVNRNYKDKNGVLRSVTEVKAIGMLMIG